jgi:hypothetical protein
MFAAFAVNTHRQHMEGRVALDVYTDSQDTLNRWLTAHSRLPLALPVSTPAPKDLPYRLIGARLAPVVNQTAAFIAYQVQSANDTAAASLTVAPASIAAAAGGVEADFKKVNFHYYMVEGYKVVTWSVHGLTYGLVSQEGNGTQRSCMICHSGLRDRDLSNTPTPLIHHWNIRKSIRQ